MRTAPVKLLLLATLVVPNFTNANVPTPSGCERETSAGALHGQAAAERHPGQEEAWCA